MSDIRMSDAFSGKLKLRVIDSDDFSAASHSESFFVIEDDSDYCCSGENHINHAIHAISSHDKLTEQNKMLRDALVTLLLSIGGAPLDCRGIVDKALEETK